MIVFIAAVSHEGVGWGGEYTPQVYPATSIQDGYDPSAGNDGREGQLLNFSTKGSNDCLSSSCFA